MLPSDSGDTVLIQASGQKPTFRLPEEKGAETYLSLASDSEVAMIERAGRRLLQGFGAGVLGTLALTASEPLRDSLLGHPPPYSVSNIARRAARAWLGVRLRPHEAQRWGLAMRWLYGPTLGLLQGWLQPALPGPAPLQGLLLGGGVWLFERLSFPRLRVTSPPRTWSSAERQWLALQCLLFGFITTSVLPRGQAAGPVRERPRREGWLPVAPATPLSPP